MSLGFIHTSKNQPSPLKHRSLIFLALLFFVFMWSTAQAHGVAGDDKAFLEQNQGRQLLIYMYLGAKHMVTGYDHLLFFVRRYFLFIPHARNWCVCHAVCDWPQRYLVIWRTQRHSCQPLHRRCNYRFFCGVQGLG